MLASVSLSGTELLIQGNPTDDTISLIGNTNSPEFTVSVAGEPSLTQTFQNDQITKVTVFAGDGDDFVANTLEIPTVIYGQGGNDTLRGGYADDIINGGDGNDDILGRTGNDVLNGQNDDDTISGGYGNDTITGGLGDDVLSGDQGDDQITGHSGNDVINGGVGADTLTGSSGNDSITGGDGDDNLNGGSGDDSLEGNQGDDTVVGETGDDFLSGGNGNDTLYGNDGNDELLGGSGDDIIFGAGGDDIIEGGLGNDELWGQDGNDTLDGQGGDDFVSGGAGNDVLAGGIGADDLRGNSGDDSLTGSTDNDIDLYRGGTGFDTFSVQGEIGNGSEDEVLDRFGMETFSGYAGPLEPSIEIDGNTLSVVGSAQRDVYTLDGFSSSTQYHVIRSGSGIIGTFATDEFSEVVFHLGGGDDSLFTDGQTVVPLRVNGGEGNDFIEGGNGPDQLFGGSGNDSIHARGGDDILVGGDGNDLLHGNLDRDLIFGSLGADRLRGDGGDDILVAGEDEDVDDVDGHGGFNEYFLDVGEDTEDANNSEPVLPVSDAPAEPVFGTSSSGSADDPDDGNPNDGDPMTASIGDLVFEDLDDNGVFDAGEVGLAGIVLRLLQDDSELATTTTDSDGNYLFDGLAAGDYTVELDSSSLDDRQVTSTFLGNVLLAEGEVNSNVDVGVSEEATGPTDPVDEDFEMVRDSFARMLSEQEFLEEASILSLVEPELTETFTIIDTGFSKLAFVTEPSVDDVNVMEYRLFGDFPATLTSQQIESSFGSSANLADGLFSGGDLSFHTADASLISELGTLEPSAQALLATDGSSTFVVSTFSPATSGTGGTTDVSMLQSAVQITSPREIVVSSMSTGELVSFTQRRGRTRADMNANTAVEVNRRIRQAWLARLDAVNAQKSEFLYWNQMGGPAYIEEIKQAIIATDVQFRIGTLTSVDPPAQYSAGVQNLVAGGFVLRPTLATRSVLAITPSETLIHESIHALNRVKPIAGGDGSFIHSDSALDERIGHGQGAFIGRFGLLNRLEQFERQLASLGAAPNPLDAAAFVANAQQEWEEIWYVPQSTLPNGSNVNASGLAATLSQQTYSDNDTGVDTQVITNAEWIELQENSINISCSALATLYFNRFQVQLECPNGMPTAFE